MNRQVYLDHNASTPVHPEVVEAMLPYFSERFGNPSSVHGFGREAREGLETAREQVAHFLRVGKEEIVFTSGGTESDNMAVKGVAMARGRGHIITSRIEHHAVLRAVETLETQGFAATYLDVDGHGMVDPDALRRAIRPDTILISLMHANSEIGTIQPARQLGAIARERGIPFHMDAVQTFGKVPIDLDAFNIDMLSFSGHKIYGPKGVAGLYIRKGTKMVSLQHGGEHERRRRAGTENVAGIVGFGKAVEIRGRDMVEEGQRLTGLRDRLWEGLKARVPEVRLNGHPTERVPGTCNVCFRHVESESIVLGLDLKGIGVSAGSACTSGNVEPSYVLVAMGVPVEWAMGAVRHSLGRSTTAQDIDYVLDSTEPLVAKLRSAMPVRA
ncbi:MAG TPA: IscS subfamily cysteine desulfurase [Candidatus Dormibacteraeota bacterium]|jgi:cysteine desulfurase|nr:IscS subfamily cysteine desulfurase [Methylomirabilota bacterium]HWN02935.1 IscS subfamily cysteine desulfurase [Candidatus Dormibacteraeota bacterium]